MEWLGGHGYSFWALWIHGVQYTKKDGSVIRGSYLPVMFENLTDPILSGREELGMPKLFSDIDIQRSENSYSVTTSWRGAQWGSFQLLDLKEVSTTAEAPPQTPTPFSIPDPANDAAQFTYRYMPTVGSQPDNHAHPAEEYFACVHIPEEKPVPKVQRSFESSSASIKLEGLDWKKLPTLHHVIQRLVEVPVYEVVGVKVTESVGVPDLASCRRIE